MQTEWITPQLFEVEKLNQYKKEWQQTGAVVLDCLVSEDDFNQAKVQVDQVFPKWEDQNKVEELAKGSDFGSNGLLEFPCSSQELNKLSVHENLLALARYFLATENIKLIQSDVWSKYGSDQSYSTSDNRDQRMHMDYGNNTMLHPSEWDNPEVVAMILYFDEHSECEGGTGFVPRRGEHDSLYKPPYVDMPGLNGTPWMNDKEEELEYYKGKALEVYKMRKELYKREKQVKFNSGSALIYRHDLWHRGTPVRVGKTRRVMNLGFAKKDCHWVTTWNQGWMRGMYEKDLRVEKLFASLSVSQRSCLGFPAPGDSYWTEKTLKWAEARWQPMGMDLSEYRNKLLQLNDH